MESVVYTRPAFYAVLLKPLAAFPQSIAYAIFSLATLSSLLWFVVRFSKECPAVPFLPAILGIAILLTRRTTDFSAGIILSLCAIKVHLFLFLPVLWLLKKRWSILGGAVC